MSQKRTSLLKTSSAYNVANFFEFTNCPVEGTLSKVLSNSTVNDVRSSKAKKTLNFFWKVMITCFSGKSSSFSESAKLRKLFVITARHLFLRDF